MLHRRGRKSHTPTMVQCPKDQLREDYTHGWIQFIHLYFCFADNKWWCSVKSGVISTCEVKINLLRVFKKQFAFSNYIGIYLEYFLILGLHAYLFQCSPLEVNSVEDTEQQEQRFRHDTCIKIITIFFCMRVSLRSVTANWNIMIILAQRSSNYLRVQCLN